VPPVPGTLVINLGDMLDRMTRGLYKSTLHRVVRNSGAHGRHRISLPLFLDPSWEARVAPIDHAALAAAPGYAEAVARGELDADETGVRWDGACLHHPAFDTSYGEYLVGKVAKVFPHLMAAVAV